MTALPEEIASFSIPLSMVVPRPVDPYVVGVGGFVVLFAILAFNVCQVSLRQRACPPSFTRSNECDREVRRVGRHPDRVIAL